MSDPSSLELDFDFLWEQLHPNIDLVAEYRAIEGRRFKFDYAHISSAVLVEVQGQIWHTGGHNTGRSLIRDYTKYNLAQSQGWIVFQLSAEMITEEWLKVIADAIAKRERINQGLLP